MYGPKPRGFWSRNQQQTNSGAAFDRLIRGRRYRVIVSFHDYDGDLHNAGEEWEFVGHSFLPCDDGLSLFVVTESDREWQIRLQWRPEAQGKILDHLEEYVEPA
jgi:hypothetical protein